MFRWHLLNEEFPISPDEKISLEVVVILKKEFNKYQDKTHYRFLCNVKVKEGDDSYAADNPYTPKDDEFRKQAEERKLYWKEHLTASIQKPSSSRPPSSTSDVIKRDGIYVAYANGIVKDTNTGLEWKAGPDKDTDWNEAKTWVKSLNLDGGGWRMPSTDELKTLYKKGTGSLNMTPLLKTTGLMVWSGETKGSSPARLFDFGFGDGYWSSRDISNLYRAFAVRSRGDG